MNTSDIPNMLDFLRQVEDLKQENLDLLDFRKRVLDWCHTHSISMRVNEGNVVQYLQALHDALDKSCKQTVALYEEVGRIRKGWTESETYLRKEIVQIKRRHVSLIEEYLRFPDIEGSASIWLNRLLMEIQKV